MTEKSTVVLVPCREYDEEKVYECIRKGVSMLGGFSSFVKPEEKILLKPNMLKASAPENAVSTHPSVFAAVLRCLSEEGYGHLFYGDSPGMTAASPEGLAKACGLSEPADRYGAVQLPFTEAETVSYPEGRRAKSFPIARDVLSCDAILSLCKMKTHALENITGACKNQYGCIAGKNKSVGHAKYPDARSFADMITDLNMFLKPRLYIMDGVVAMEGNGPSAGNPVPMNVLLMSRDPVALDTVFAELIDLPPECVPTIVSGAKAGLGKMKPEEIRVLTPEGELSLKSAGERYGRKEFQVNRRKASFWNPVSTIRMALSGRERPVLDPSLCVGCGVCEMVCPVEGKAVHAGGGKKASYEYKKCIRCFCCQEMCPQKAIARKYRLLRITKCAQCTIS